VTFTSSPATGGDEKLPTSGPVHAYEPSLHRDSLLSK
jgi:hypothetical protein